MCFFCRLFVNQENDTHLSVDGFNNWKNLAAHLRQHMKSAEHITTMDTWRNILQKLQTNHRIALEVIHWNETLRRLTTFVNHLADHTLAFRGHSDRLFESGNGNYLGQVQLTAQFDPVKCEHLRRFQAKELSGTFLSKHIQNKLISIVKMYN